LRDVVVPEREAAAGVQVLDVGRAAGDEVVHADDLVALGQEALAQVRADEPGPPGDDGTHGSLLEWNRQRRTGNSLATRRPAGYNSCASSPPPPRRRGPWQDGEPALKIHRRTLSYRYLGEGFS